MTHRNRDLLLLLKTASLTEEAIEKHVACLHKVLLNVEAAPVFCSAHELVARNKITRKSKAILRAIHFARLRPFYFLINKN